MSDARIWDVRLLVDGEVPCGTPVIAFKVSASRYAECDTAELHLAVDRQALQGVCPWFDPVVPTRMDVQLQLLRRDIGGASWQTIFQGIADYVVWSPDKYRVIVECRDYLSLLLDARVQEAWLNCRAAELIERVVAMVGLSSDVDLGNAGSVATGMTGQFWQVEHKRGSALAQHRFQTAFDIAFFLAREANCDLFARGKTIVARPILSSDDENALIHEKTVGALTALLHRDLAAPDGIIVHLASWDSRQRSRTETFFDGFTFSSEPPAKGLMHSFRVPGRRLDDLQTIARGKYMRIMAQQRHVRLRLPGCTDIRPRSFMRLSKGAGTTWPDIMGIDSVVSQMSSAEGFVQDIIFSERSA